ncbi:MAG: transposase [Gammaproteobacteria bacterium]|nr:transposase [Gammaproteobacteria bacterium]
MNRKDQRRLQKARRGRQDGSQKGNGRARVFHDARDYGEFVSLMRQACDRIPRRISAWCLMPNHFHFVPWPASDGNLGRWMHWLLTSHVRRHHKRYGTDGRI